MKYVRSLDGVRGIAVLLVVFFHFGYFPPGWVGVQVFFTLSGYLITSILLEDRGLPLGAYLGRFYWRRALRIVPLYVAFLVAAAGLFRMLGSPASFPADWPYLVTYTANFARIRDGDIGPSFVHIWSLAVEEQFYLVWPLLIFFLSQPAFRKTIIAVLLLSPVLRFALFAALTTQGHDPSYAGKLAYVLPFTQFDAFAAGAALPVFGLARLKRPGLLLVASLAVAAILGFGILVVDQYTRGYAFIASLGYPMYMARYLQYVWGYSLLNVISLLGIVCVVRGLPALKFLGNALLVRTGRVSYGVYVYHLPLLLIAERAARRAGIEWTSVSRGCFFVAYFGVVMLVSEISFRWWEAPFLRLKDHWRDRARVEPVEPKLPEDASIG